MPFYSAGDGDLKTAFVSDAWLLDQFLGNALYGWGAGTGGQLADNVGNSTSSPIQTISGGINWNRISAGNQHSGAIKIDGTLWCWGTNSSGQLGDNTITIKRSPVQTVTFGSNWKQVSVGVSHTAAIKTDGTLWCWGDNSNGVLGNNTATARSSPVQTAAYGNNWKQVSAGANNTAAIKTDGTLWCWGSNLNGQIGNNTSIATNRSSPIQTVTFATNWKQVSCGNSHIAAIKTDGTCWSWGDNSSGQLGDNTRTSRSSPVQTVAFGTNWKQISCGNSFTGAIKLDGTLWLWGANASGQLGDNTTAAKSSPVQTISYGTNWRQVSCSIFGTSSSAIKTDGTLWNWGLGTSGQLGDNTLTSKSSPVQTKTYGTNWKQVSSGSAYTAAVTNGDI